jgi:hypothetical protein
MAFDACRGALEMCFGRRKLNVVGETNDGQLLKLSKNVLYTRGNSVEISG